MSDIGPGWQARWFKCLRCAHSWEGWLPTHCAVDVWLVIVKAMRCTQCGARARHIVFDLAREREGDEP